MSRCKDCGAEVAYLQRLISGAAVAVDPATVRPSDVVFVGGLHKLHVCAPVEPDTRQRNLFGEEE